MRQAPIRLFLGAGQVEEAEVARRIAEAAAREDAAVALERGRLDHQFRCSPMGSLSPRSSIRDSISP